MSNIFSGSATEKEIESFIGGRPLVAIYAKDKDNPNVDGDYPFWSDIRHPETGKTLQAVKGYCEPIKSSYLGERLCYYAEYRDATGVPYYYLDARYFCKPEFRGTKSISEQQHEDRQELKQTLALADEDFLSKYRSKGEMKISSDEDFLLRGGKDKSPADSTQEVSEKNGNAVDNNVSNKIT